MTFQPSAPHKRSRWLALLAIVMLASSLLVTSAIAAPEFIWIVDQDGRNDEPGQKDLTAQANDLDGSTYWVAWRWDEIAWNGGNTGDACGLFDSGTDGLVDYAVCVTVGGKPAVEQDVRVYTCGNTRDDRCTNPELVAGSFEDDCTVEQVTAAPFASGETASTDTQATCNVTAMGITGLNSSRHINSCSYPSQEPNSDPSDCVIIVANVDVTVSTLSEGGITWTATLDDTATLNPASAGGSVVFKLYSGNPCIDPDPTTTPATVGNLVWTSGADTAAPFRATHGGVGTPSGGNVITGTGPTTNLTYYWIATYTPSGAFNGDSSVCGEATTINASVVGVAGS